MNSVEELVSADGACAPHATAHFASATELGAPAVRGAVVPLALAGLSADPLGDVWAAGRVDIELLQRQRVPPDSQMQHIFAAAIFM